MSPYLPGGKLFFSLDNQTVGEMRGAYAPMEADAAVGEQSMSLIRGPGSSHPYGAVFGMHMLP